MKLEYMVRMFLLHRQRKKSMRRLNEVFDKPVHVVYPYRLADGCRACPLEWRRGRGCVGRDCEHYESYPTEFDCFSGVCMLIDGDWPE